MLRLVLFDIDGTLVDTGGAGVKAFGRACELEFQVSNGAQGLSFAGRTDPSIVRDFFSRHGIEPSPGNFQRFFECYVFLLDHLIGSRPGRVLPGVMRLIAEFRAMPQPPVLGLLTGNILLGAQIKLLQFGLWQHFVTGGFGDDHEDRDQIAAVAHRRGSRVMGRALCGEEVLVVGDTPLDIRCGRAIGAKTLAVATGGCRREQLREHQPTWLVEHLDETSARDLCNHDES